jgi:hypothetical protein
LRNKKAASSQRGWSGLYQTGLFLQLEPDAVIAFNWRIVILTGQDFVRDSVFIREGIT